MKNAFERTEYRLAWIPIADNQVNVRVDQSRQNSHLLRVYHPVPFTDLEISLQPHCRKSTVSDQDGVSGEKRLAQIARHDRADIFDDCPHPGVLLFWSNFAFVTV